MGSFSNLAEIAGFFRKLLRPVRDAAPGGMLARRLI
jgi:hypothetical protein